MNKKNILVIAPYFPPSGVVGAKRPARLVTALVEHGWSCHVLTLAEGCALHLDKTGATIPASDLLTITRIPCRSPWQHAAIWATPNTFFGKLQRFVLRVFAKLTRSFLTVDELGSWAEKAVARGQKVVREEKIDLIWATAPPLSGHVVASRLSQLTAVPMVLDYRDVRLPKPEIGLENSIEARCLANASGVTVTAPGQLNILRQYCRGFDELSHRVINNALKLPNAMEIKTENLQPVLVHGGSLYVGKRDIGGFLKGVISANETLSREKGVEISFFNFGPESDRKYLSSFLRDESASKRVKFLPLQPASEFFEICRSSRVLVLFVGRDDGRISHEQALPGKIFDYFTACRPILVIGPFGSAAAVMVDTFRRGLCAEENDHEAISVAINKLFDDDYVKSKIDLSTGPLSVFSESAFASSYVEFLGKI